MRANLNISLPTFTPSRPGKGARSGAGEGTEAAELEQLRLREAAREFEGLLLEQMVKEMRKAVPKSGLLGDEPGQELFEEMLDGEFVRLMTRKGGIGIADYLTRSLGGDLPQK